jgi:hypothetical protein
MNTSQFGPFTYPLGAFHLLVQEAAQEVCRHVQAPDALVGMSFLAVMSAACQGLIDVKLPTGQIRPVSLNLFAIAESGERKTAVDNRVAKPLHERMVKRQRAYNDAKDDYEYQREFWNDTNRSLMKKRLALVNKGQTTEQITQRLLEHRRSKPLLPRMRQIIREDLTKRSFVDALHGDGESIALMSSEGGVLLNSDAMRQLALLNSAWDGSALSLDRANDDHALAQNPRVTISIMAQPSVFQDYMTRHGTQARGTGLLARCLIGWPLSTQGYRGITRDEPTWNKLGQFHARAEQLLDEYDQQLAVGKVERTLVTFTDEAKQRWFNVAEETERRTHPQGDFHGIKDFASKSCEIVGRIAAVMHHFTGQEGAITVDTVERAIAIMRWHTFEFLRLFSINSDIAQLFRDADELKRWLFEHVVYRGVDQIRHNDLLRLGPVKLRTKRRLEPALHLLIQHQCAWVFPDKTRTRWVKLNLTHFAHHTVGAL